MRFVWLIFVGLVVAMLGLLPRLKSEKTKHPSPPPAARKARKQTTSAAPAPIAAFVIAPSQAQALVRTTSQRDSIVLFGMQQLGTKYSYAGTTPATGFDCSGFVQYVFSHFRVPVPHATALLIDAGVAVPRDQAQPGDIVVFTGTAQGDTTPGHAGIIIAAAPAGPIRFVHSSSARRESGVKVSQVEGSGYEQRFMQVRRVVGLNQIRQYPLKIQR